LGHHARPFIKRKIRQARQDPGSWHPLHSDGDLSPRPLVHCSYNHGDAMGPMGVGVAILVQVITGQAIISKVQCEAGNSFEWRHGGA